MKRFALILMLTFCLNLFAQDQFSVFFDSNKHQLTPTEETRLQGWIAANPEAKILAIHGFTDEDGTTGFNDTLASRRVKSIYDMIKGKVKIRDDFKTVSFGEKFKQSQNKAENRKATIFYLEPKDLAREDEILGIKPMPKPKPKIDYPSKISVRNPDGKLAEYKLDTVFMKKVNEAKSGEKLKLENLNFIVNTFAIVPESRAKMFELLLVMQNNPDLKIEIQGHLCCQPVDRLDLSTKRAKAVYNFLIANEIYKGRLSYKGFGSSQPIYPLPEKNEAERAANRRVEILIVEN